MTTNKINKKELELIITKNRDLTLAEKRALISWAEKEIKEYQKFIKQVKYK